MSTMAVARSEALWGGTTLSTASLMNHGMATSETAYTTMAARLTRERVR